MNRRDFLFASAAAAATAGVLGPGLGWAAQGPATGPAAVREELMARFRAILEGFLRNARDTGAEYAVCDFPGGTKIKGCCTPAGKTYTSVARMLPALAEFVAAKPARIAGEPDLTEVLLSVYRTAFDPRHADYWGEPTGSKPTQRSVEASLVAIALARLGPEFVSRLTPAERANVNRWLASCTVIPERTNNHAWFTAVNQAARLKLSRTFPEFHGDEAWMIEDLKAMDGLAANAADGWYSDDPKLTVYDYYNFWTFGNFPLFWSRIAGDLYPEWNTKLRARAREFLQSTPYFFGGDGAVPLFGRSLLYRWALLSPLVLGYEQGLWPHSPGLLRRIMRKNFAWWWEMGAYDAKFGKLREKLSPDGTEEVTEGYIDNGHPYWAMQAFTFFSLPANDPLWTASEEQLPVEKADFRVRLAGPRMILAGTKSSGQVRWLQARNMPRRDYYRDKYNKFTWSSSFPCNVRSGSKQFAPWDQTLVFREVATGVCATRIFPDDGELLDDGVRTTWRARLDGGEAKVVSTIRLAGDFEFRHHAIVLQPKATSGAVRDNAGTVFELIEGSYPLGVAEGEEPERAEGQGWLSVRSRRSGHLLVTWNVNGHDGLKAEAAVDPAKPGSLNLVHGRTVVLSASKRFTWSTPGPIELVTLHYASPKPDAMKEVQARAQELLKRMKG